MKKNRNRESAIGEDMFFKNKEKRKLSKSFYQEYQNLIVLDYIGRKNTVDEDFFQPHYFREELKINDIRNNIKGLTHKRLVQKKDTEYALTDKGIDFLNKNEDLISFFRYASPYVDVKKYIKVKQKKGDDASFEDIMLELFSKKIAKYRKKNDFVSVKDLCFDMATLLEVKEEYKKAIYYYLLTLYFEVNGLEYYDLFVGYINGKYSTKTLKAEYDYIYINPKVKNAIERLKEHYEDDLVDIIYEKNPISLKLCKKSKFKELVSTFIERRYDNHAWQIEFWHAFNDMISVSNKYK